MRTVHLLIVGWGDIQLKYEPHGLEANLYNTPPTTHTHTFPGKNVGERYRSNENGEKKICDIISKESRTAISNTGL